MNIDKELLDALVHMRDLHGAQLKLHELDDKRINRLHWMVSLLALSQMLICYSSFIRK